MGFISRKLEEDVAEKLDDLIKLGRIGELVDGPAAALTLRLLDENFGDKVPEKFQDEILLALEGFAYDDLDKINKAVGSTIDEFVDLPFADADFTSKWIALNMQALVKAIQYYGKQYLG